MAYCPLPNNYEIGDGLNTAGFRWLRRPKGIDNLFGSGEATGDRKQINVKIDHNFTSYHKANVNVSYERVLSDDFYKPYPERVQQRELTAFRMSCPVVLLQRCLRPCSMRLAWGSVTSGPTRLVHGGGRSMRVRSMRCFRPT